jgi:hypothetical protein
MIIDSNNAVGYCLLALRTLLNDLILHAHSRGKTVVRAMLRDPSLLPPGAAALKDPISDRTSYRACDELTLTTVLSILFRPVLHNYNEVSVSS